jgi:hypothetical protein
MGELVQAAAGSETIGIQRNGQRLRGFCSACGVHGPVTLLRERAYEWCLRHADEHEARGEVTWDPKEARS